MKKHITHFLREYFSFSVKERRGMLVLASILFCLLLLRAAQDYFMPYASLSVSPGNWTEQVQIIETRTEQVPVWKTHAAKEPSALFAFDPNRIDSAGLLALGFSPKQSAAFLKYRLKGAVFRKKEDLKKVFFIDEKKYAQLEPWIRLEEEPIQPGMSLRKAKKETKPRLVSINSCDSVLLVGIKGIGAYTASKVLRYRDWLGGFISPDQFAEIKGLRPEQIDTLRRYCTVDPSAIQRIAINTLSKEALEQHPYIRFKAKVLVKYREQHGAFKHPSDLIKTGVIDEPLLRKLEPYLTF